MEGRLIDEGQGNEVNVCGSIDVRGRIKGNNNRVIINSTELPSSIHIFISGNNNKVEIGAHSKCKNLDLRIGNHVPAHDVKLVIGSYFSCEDQCRFLLYNSGSEVAVGDDCMFSNSIILRAGESPHLIFDSLSGEYLDVSSGVVIGDHVWIGERAYITKRSTIPSGCILAACSVATKRFEEENCVLAGNPARIARRNVAWVRNRSHLTKDSSYSLSYQRQQNKHT